MANPTEKYAVIGCDISYSRSPLIHNSWFKHYGIDAEYAIIDVQPEELSKAMQQGLSGANVTIPYKKSILQYAENPEGWDAVNTIKFTGAGAIATNTDALAVRQSLRGQDANSNALIIGNGGAAVAAHWALSRVGITSVAVLSRNFERSEFKNKPVEQLSWFADEFLCESFDIVINATPPSARIPPGIFKFLTEALVVDFVYGQPDQQLTAFAKQNKLSLITGQDLLISQAQHAFEFWFGIFPTVDAEFMGRVFPERAA